MQTDATQSTTDALGPKPPARDKVHQLVEEHLKTTRQFIKVLDGLYDLKDGDHSSVKLAARLVFVDFDSALRKFGAEYEKYKVFRKKHHPELLNKKPSVSESDLEEGGGC